MYFSEIQTLLIFKHNWKSPIDLLAKSQTQIIIFLCKNTASPPPSLPQYYQMVTALYRSSGRLGKIETFDYVNRVPDNQLKDILTEM